MSSQLGNLTAAERLLIDRRRRKENQTAAAQRHKVSISAYCRWERGQEEQGLPSIKLGRLKPHERCLLYRRRSGVTQEQVAQELGCCRWWLNLMERGLRPCDELLWYWEQ